MHCVDYLMGTPGRAGVVTGCARSKKDPGALLYLRAFLSHAHQIYIGQAMLSVPDLYELSWSLLHLECWIQPSILPLVVCVAVIGWAFLRPQAFRLGGGLDLAVLQDYSS